MCGSRKYSYPPTEGHGNSEGVGASKRGKFPKGKGATQRVLCSGCEMRLNEHYRTFPIDSGNQTNRNVPSVEINVRFFVIYFPFFFRRCTTDGNPEYHVCWTSS